MDAPKAPDTPPALSIAPAKFEIVLAEDGGNPLAFVSPPIADISEMAEIEKACFSLGQHVEEGRKFEDAAKERLEAFQRKEARFDDSATFHNRLANLQRAVGQLEAEGESLRRAAALDSRSFFLRKTGENLLRSGNKKLAQEAFARLSATDSHSALRLASMCVLGQDLAGAERWVAHAIELEPDGYAERLFQGGILLFKREFQNAIKAFWMALSERPHSSVAYSNLGLAYLGANNAKKAFSCLKRSVALDPLNRSAILALADVGYMLNRDSDTINSIRYFVQFEQREPAIWSRLARSLLKLGAIDECIGALKRQGAFENSASIWNNLGVAYAKKGNKTQSLESFKYALAVSGQAGSREDLVVARNIAQLVSTLGKPSLLRGITSPILESDTERAIARDPQICDIYGFHIGALIQTDARREALSLAEELVKDPTIGESLAKWLVQSLSGIYGLNRNEDVSLHRLLDNFLLSDLASLKDVGLMNNTAFALAELGRLDEAEQCVSRVSQALHKDAYLTATLGLINFRRGKAKRGETLYREAIGLAKTRHDKARIRQKMFLEIGSSSSLEAKEAKRAFEKVIKEREGEAALTARAKLLLADLRTS